MAGRMKIITEPKEAIANYIADKQNTKVKWVNYVAIGLVDAFDKLVAGVVFEGYNHPVICMHIAADKMTPSFAAAIMDYPFNQLKCKRVTGIIEKRNKKSRRFANHLCAKLEGVMVDASEVGDVCIYGLLAKDAQKWLSNKYQRKLGVI
jgi:hypothetical protein